MKLKLIAMGIVGSIVAAVAVAPVAFAAEDTSVNTGTAGAITLNQESEGDSARPKGGLFEPIAELLNTTIEELRARLAEGESLLEIADEQGQGDAVRQLLVDQITERITEGVESGRLPQERADEMLENLDEKVDSILNRTDFGERGRHGRFGRGFRGGCDGTHMNGGEPPAAGEDTTTAVEA